MSRGLRAVLQRTPFGSRLRSRPVRSRRARFAALFAPFILLAVFALVLWRVARPAVDVEAQVRRSALPALAKALGMPIEIGRIESDYLSRVVLHDVIAGRDAKSPIGAHFRARRVVLSLDFLRLVRGEDALSSLRSVALDSPQMWLERDAKGRTNWDHLLNGKSNATGWTGRISVAKGRVWLRDTSLQNERREAFSADIAPLDGSLDVAPDATAFRFAGARALVGKRRAPISDVAFDGRFSGGTAQSKAWLATGIRWRQAPLAVLAGYAFPTRDVVARAGTASGNAEISFDAALSAANRILVSGALQIENAHVSAGALREPATQRPVEIRAINGPLEFSNRAARTTGLSFIALDSPWNVAGTAALPPETVSALPSVGTRNSTVLDVAFAAYLESRALDSTRVLAAVRPLLPSGATLRSGPARTAIRLVGTPRAWQAKGRYASPTLAARANGSDVSAVSPSIVFAFDNQTRRASGTFRAATARATQSGATVSATSPDVRFAFDEKNERISGNFKAISLRARTNDQAVAVATPNLVFAFDNRTQRAAGNLRAASLQASANDRAFSASDVATKFAFDARARRASGNFAATLIDARADEAQGRARGFSTTFALTDARGTRQMRAVFSADGWNARAASGRNDFGGASADGKAARGALAWSNRADATTFALRLAARGGELRAAKFGQARGTVRELVVRGSSRGAQMPLSVALSLENWAASGNGSARSEGNFGALRGRDLRLLASTSNFNRAAWRGQAQVRGVAANEIRLAAFSPEAARAVRDAEISDLGMLDARVRFAPRAGAKGPTDLVFAGDVRLSRARVAGEELRDIALTGNFDGTRWEIAEARAQSNFGALSGRLASEGIGGARFDVPNIAIPAALLDRVLAPQNLRFDGAATGRLQVQSAASGMRVRFALASKRGVVREARTNRAIARLENATLRGDGVLHGASVSAKNSGALRFDGDAALQAARVLVASDAPRVPPQMRGAALRGLQTQMDGQFSDLQASRFAGDVRFARASFAIPGLGAKSTVLGASKSANGVRSISTVLADGSAVFRCDARGLEVARFAARAFPDASKRRDAARLRGSFAVRRSGAIAAQVLAERFDAARVQDALSSVVKFAPRLRGIAYARLNVAGTLASPRLGIDARVLNGALVLPSRTLPFDATRASFAFTSDTVEVRDATVWSRGARLAFEGKATRISFGGEEEADDYALDVAVRADAVRLRDAVAIFPTAPRDLDGLASGQFRIAGTLGLPRFEGDAKLALVSLWGVPLEEGTARLRYQMTADGPRLAIEDIVGRSGAARLAGRFIADAPADQWRFALATSGVDTSRALRGAARTNPNSSLRSAPLRGTLRADIDVRGRFGENLALVPQEGGAQIKAAALRWRGRDVGTLDADVSLDGTRVSFNQISLRDETNPDSPTLKIAGSAPLDAEEATLAVSVEAKGAQLELLHVALEEAQKTLRDNNSSNAFLETLVRGWDDLPRRLEGEANLSAKISGALVAPVAEISLGVRNAKMGEQKLPSLETALRFEGDALTVNTLELKQSEAVAGEDEPRETVLRLSPGGRVSAEEISLDGELLGADLRQLAPWIAVLQDDAGAPVLQGEVALFNFQVRGATASPEVTGSLEAQKLTFRNYTLDRLRLARFHIAEGRFAVEPGNFTVVKGGFQSSAVWGSVPWNWSLAVPGESTVEIHVPIQTGDFGALAGAFVPALREAAAEGFSGELEIGGTIEQPQFAGEIAMKNVRFATAALSGADVGVRALSGTLRFGPGNVLQLDNLQGELARASEIAATATGNRPANARPVAVDKSLLASGKFRLNGGVALKLGPQVFESAARFVAAQRYDLALNLDKAEFARADFSGVRDLTLDATLKTGAGAEEIAQRVTWQFSGAGRELRAKGKAVAAGRVRSAGNAMLDFEDVARTRWDGTLDLRAFAFDAPNLARGRIDGDLKFLQLAVARPQALLARASLEQRLGLARAAEKTGSTVEFDRTLKPAVETRSAAAVSAAAARAGEIRVPGVEGSLSLSETEISGAPVGTVGVATLLPLVPAFDIRFLVGRNVRFISPTLRADFAGGLQISGTPRDPNITGTLLARDGQIRFPGAAARISSAEVDINVARDKTSGLVRSSAVIDATARGQAGKYTITLHVRGPLDFGSNNAQELRIDVTSNPPLSQDEAFARLTGTSIRDLQASGATGSKTNQAYASAFLSVVSAPLFSGIERSLAQAFGLSNITLDYRLNEPVSVLFGKSVGERVYVSYKRSLSGSRPGEPASYQFRVDYRIRGDFQLGVQTDERNQSQVTLEKTFRF